MRTQVVVVAASSPIRNMCWTILMELIERCKTGKPVLIFGAAIQGEIVLRLLELNGIKPTCFIDNDQKKQLKPYHTYQVMGFEVARTAYPDAIIIIAAGWHAKEMRAIASEAGYTQIYSDMDIVDNTDLSKFTYEELKPIAWKLASTKALAEIDGQLYMARLNLVVTTRCTLNCDRCTSLMQYYKQPKTYDTQFLLDEMRAILSAVDRIGRMEILGGEPFLHPHLPEIVTKIVKSEQVFQIDIVTNGTILPAPGYLLGFKHENVRVIVNDYGTISAKAELLLRRLRDLGVIGLEHRHWKWAEVGEFDRRHRSYSELVNLFRKCGAAACTEVVDGKLHRCSRSSHGTALGLIPSTEEDCVDIFGTNVRENIKQLFERTYITACDYCDGVTEETLIHVPAIQRKR